MPNDPVINNIASMAMQILHEAQGARDISGAVPGDYETLSPVAGASVQIVNAQSRVPFKKLVNILPMKAQEGSGTPALDNVRKIPAYEKSILRNGNSDPFEVELENFYAGKVDFTARQVESAIIRVRIPADVDWQLRAGTSFNYFIVNDAGIPRWLRGSSSGRFATGENCQIVFAGSTADLLAGGFALSTVTATPQKMYYRPAAEQEFEDADAFKAWLTENDFYIYYALVTPKIIPIKTTIPYVLRPEYTISADYGTLSVEYSGIAPEGTSGGLGAGWVPAPEQIIRPETPAIVEPIAEEIKNQEDEEK